MVERDYVRKQLKAINFGSGWWNHAEVEELRHILMAEEKIYECVNGYYEGGVALLVATDIRILLIDKKPMGFLNVDDLRFDMISDLDYSHRLLGAQVNISCGSKNLVFKSYNQPRLRKLMGHIQHRISEIKKEQSEHAVVQKQHLEEINRQLQMYLLAQQQQLQNQLSAKKIEEPIKPSPKLADYLFAQRLMEEFHNGTGASAENTPPPTEDIRIANEPIPSYTDQKLLDEMAEAGRREVFGGGDKITHTHPGPVAAPEAASGISQGLDITPFRIAYAKLPYLLKTRRYRPPIAKPAA